MVKVSVDAQEVRELSVSLAAIPEQLQRHAKPIIKEGGQALQKGMKADLVASTHFKGAARDVTYDIVDGGFGVEAGPENPIASIGYFGGAPWTQRVNPGRGWQQGPGGGGTVRDPREVLLEVAPPITRSIADLAVELLR